jgi:branched-chain amino acid aminotransferase
MQSKSAANYSNAALARVEALKNGYDEAIMLNSSGKVAEGSAENIFIIKNGIIKTPPLNADILNGITRDSLIQLIKVNGIKLVEKNITVKEMLKADEIFMTGTAAEVKSVTKINKTLIGNGKIGNITKKLQKAFIDAAMGKDRDFTSWLQYI